MDIAWMLMVNGLLFAAIATLIVALFRYPVPKEPPVHRRIALAVGAGNRQTLFEQPAISPLMSLALTLAQRFTFFWVRQRIRRDLDASGNPNGYSVEEYVAICLAAAVSLGMVSTLLAGMIMGQFDPLILLSMMGLGFLLPMATIRATANKRLMLIGKKLPYTLDLIALMMEAGSTFSEAVDTIIRDEPQDDFNQELALLQSEISFGTSRSVALTNLAQRIPLEALQSIVGAVNQAETLGTPLSTILKSQSGMLRLYRSVRAEKLSASASLRILIPSMLILMAVVLILLGPMILHYVQKGSLF